MIGNEFFNLDYSADALISVLGTALETVFVLPVSQIEENEQGGTLYWRFAIFDLDDRMLHTDCGRIGLIGALPQDKAKAVADYVAVQEGIRWVSDKIPDAAIEVIQTGGTNE